jgi:translation initiation factor 2B subunit (eIF-2B alpha/beta/delta family)
MNNSKTEEINDAIQEIQLDNTSGSIELAKKSAELLIRLINQDDSYNYLINTAYALIKAQPNMASIFNLVNDMMFKIDRNKGKQPKKIVNAYCEKYLENLENSDKKISEKTNEIIKNNGTIITHSYSSTVLSTFLYAKRFGKRFTVICTESRPKKEGINLVRKLGRNKIKVKLLVDSAVFSLIPYADLILVGGDAVTDTGLINKIGTKGIAMTANHYNTPIYALCSTIKFLPKNYPVTLDHLKNPDEIIKSKIINVSPINYYFDYTPLEFITGFITEKEILKPEEVKEKIKHLKIHKNLSSLISGSDF